MNIMIHQNGRCIHAQVTYELDFNFYEVEILRVIDMDTKQDVQISEGNKESIKEKILSNHLGVYENKKSD